MLQSYAGLSPVCHRRSFVHEGAYLIGDVVLCEGVSVWPTAVLRGDMGRIVIGRDSNIQDGAICHDTTSISETIVGERVTVGHRAILHGCVIEDDCLIGMGAIVLDNTRIGKGSLVAAGAVVPANKVIPANSLVMGVPGRVVRSTNESDKKRIAFAYRSYLDKLEHWLGS